MWFEFPNIDPVAFAVGPFAVRWYALAYIAGILLGWFYALRLVKGRDDRPNSEDVDDFVSWAILGIIFGGRLGYVLFYNFSYYMTRPLDALKVWEGGMAFHGGVLGVLVAMIVFARLRQISFLRLADIVCAVVPIGLLFGRIANFINGELFGRVTDGPWGMVFPHGGDLPRHASQLYEAALEGAVLFAILFVLMRSPLREKPGFVGGAFLAGYGVFRFIIEFVREPDAHIGLLGDVISQGQLLSLPMVVIGAVAMIWAGKTHAKSA